MSENRDFQNISPDVTEPDDRDGDVHDVPIKAQFEFTHRVFRCGFNFDRLNDRADGY